MKPITIVSSSSDHRDYATHAILASHKMNIQRAHIDSHNFTPDSKTLTTLGTLGITHHDNHSSQLTQSLVKSTHLVAMDESTRNKVQEKFGKFIPLFSEVAQNKTFSIPISDKISAIHMIENNKENFKKRVHLFF